MLARKFEVCQKLSFMDREQSIHTLQLYNYLTVDQKIQTIANIEYHSFVSDRQLFLALERYVSILQLPCETNFIS